MVYAEDLSRNGSRLNSYNMGKGNGSFLLTHGDILHVTHEISIRFNSFTYVRDDCFSAIQTRELEVGSPPAGSSHPQVLYSDYGNSCSESSILSLPESWASEHMEKSTWQSKSLPENNLLARLRT